jgi:hypothetical protein
LLVVCDRCHASAFVKGAYYRLGDEDPGATAGAIGADPTRDTFVDALHLGRSGSPHYAADVPALGPVGDKLSMAFANGGLGGPAVPGFYGRDAALPVVPQGLPMRSSTSRSST